MKLFQNKLLLFTVALVLVAAGIMLAALLGGGRNTPLGQALGAVVTPIEGALTHAGDWLSDIFGYFYRYSALVEENLALKNELTAYRALEAEYWEAVNENQALKRLNNLSQSHRDLDLEMCSVISYDGTGYLSTFTINRGSASGVKRWDPVMVEEGLIGYVTEVGPNYANVATLLHQDAKVSAMITRTRDVAVVQGDFQLSEQGRLKLSYLRNDADVQVGDWAMSTGSGGGYPRGLLIGRVVDFRLESHGASSYAVIEPVVELENLTGVFVIKAFEVTD